MVMRLCCRSEERERREKLLFGGRWLVDWWVDGMGGYDGEVRRGYGRILWIQCRYSWDSRYCSMGTKYLIPLGAVPRLVASDTRFLRFLRFSIGGVSVISAPNRLNPTKMTLGKTR